MTPAEIERIKDILPTSLGSDEIRRNLAADILRRAVFSARMSSASYLAKVREVCALLSAGEISQADARNRLESVLDQLGYSMQDGGGIKNPASIRRLNLILETQTQMAASVARLMAQTPATLYANPGWRFARISPRNVPRIDWPSRWSAAGQSVGWEGASMEEFVALKSSPIWQALGDGVGGFRDTLFNPYPPFAYSSGMGWIAASREECLRLGLVQPSNPATPQPRNPATLSPGESAVKDAIERYGFDNIMEGLS